MPSDYYTLLGVAHNASPDEIKRQYKKLAIKYHPDKTHEKHHHEKFLRIQEAYETLKDEGSRQKYNMKVGLNTAAFSHTSTSVPFPHGYSFATSHHSATRDSFTRTTPSYYAQDHRFKAYSSYYTRASRPSREETEREEQKNAEKLHNMVNERMKEASRRRQEEYIHQARKQREEQERAEMEEQLRQQKQERYENSEKQEKYEARAASEAFAQTSGFGDAKSEYESAKEAAYRRAREAEMHAYQAMYGSNSYEERRAKGAEYIVVDDEVEEEKVNGQEEEEEEEEEDAQREQEEKLEHEESNYEAAEEYEDKEQQDRVDGDDGVEESPERDNGERQSRRQPYSSAESDSVSENEGNYMEKSPKSGSSRARDEIRAWRANVETERRSTTSRMPEHHQRQQYDQNKGNKTTNEEIDDESGDDAYGDAENEFEDDSEYAEANASANAFRDSGTVPPADSFQASYASESASPSHSTKRRPEIVEVSEDSDAESENDSQTGPSERHAYFHSERPATAGSTRYEKTTFDEKLRATNSSAKKPRLANYDGMKNSLHTYLDDVDFSDIKSTLPNYSHKARKASLSNAPPSPKRPRYAEYADGKSRAETLHTPVNKAYSRRTAGTISTSDLSPHIDDSALIFSAEVPAFTVGQHTTKTEWDEYVTRINDYERKFSLYRKAIFEYQIGRYEKDERHHNIIYSDTSCLDVHQSCLFNDILLLQNYTRALQEFRRTLKAFSVNCDIVNKSRG